MTKTSVIIPTYNGRHKIGNLLQSLESQTHSDFETLVVIDGSTDGTLDYLHKEKWNLANFKIISQSNCGRAQVRNKGAKKASGELLIFIDDDMRMEPNAISLHIDHHQKFSNSILVGNQIEDLAKCKTSIQKYKAYKSRFWGEPQEKYPKALKEKNIFLTGANFSISKNLFDTLEGFNPKLTDGEDLELALRAHFMNTQLYFNREILGWHDDFISADYYIRRLQEYSSSIRKIVSLHPDWVGLFHFSQKKKLTGFKKVLHSFFGISFWISVIDSFNIFLIFPKGLRYKFYDLILTANSR